MVGSRISGRFPYNESVCDLSARAMTLTSLSCDYGKRQHMGYSFHTYLSFNQIETQLELDHPQPRSVHLIPKSTQFLSIRLASDLSNQSDQICNKIQSLDMLSS